MKISFLEVLGEKIFYVDENTNKPKVLFFHGFMSKKNFAESLLKYSRNWDYLAIDFPGCGQSSFESKIDISFYQKIAAAFVEKYGLHKIKLIVGHSLGAASIMYLLEKKFFQKAILIAPFNPFIISHCFDDFSRKNIKNWLLPKNFDQTVYSLKNIVDKTQKTFLKFLTFSAKNFLVQINLKRNLFEEMVLNQILNESYLKSDFLLHLYQNNLSKVTIISGNQDKFVARTSIEKLVENTQTETIFLENCGHYTIYEKSFECYQIINQIFESLEDII